MSPEVCCEDVAMVLYLYEMAMVTLFGTYYVTPPPELGNLDADNLPFQVNKLRKLTLLCLQINWLNIISFWKEIILLKEEYTHALSHILFSLQYKVLFTWYTYIMQRSDILWMLTKNADQRTNCLVSNTDHTR